CRGAAADLRARPRGLRRDGRMAHAHPPLLGRQARPAGARVERRRRTDKAGENRKEEVMSSVLNPDGEVLDRQTVRFRRVLPGPIERVWAYLTEADKRAKWFAGG